MNKQNRNRLIDTGGCKRRGSLGDWVKKLKGLRSIHWQLQNSHGDVKYSIGNIGNNIAITMCDARWALEIWRGTFCKVYDCLTSKLYT